MSKSIYKEAIEILLNMGTEFISVPCNPIGEENSDMIHLRDATETYETNMYEVVKALKQAQKQEKLLTLYREKEKHEQEFSALNHMEYEDYQRIKTKIWELENERT